MGPYPNALHVLKTIVCVENVNKGKERKKIKQK